MKKLLPIAALLLLASPVAASETCIQIARAILTADPAFPQIVEATTQELRDWPTECAATPPTGEGRLQQVCRAETGAAPIYFYLRKSSTSQTLGYETCGG
jgi:hypothetical protein